MSLQTLFWHVQEEDNYLGSLPQPYAVGRGGVVRLGTLLHVFVITPFDGNKGDPPSSVPSTLGRPRSVYFSSQCLQFKPRIPQVRIRRDKTFVGSKTSWADFEGLNGCLIEPTFARGENPGGKTLPAQKQTGDFRPTRASFNLSQTLVSTTRTYTAHMVNRQIRFVFARCQGLGRNAWGGIRAKAQYFFLGGGP